MDDLSAFLKVRWRETAEQASMLRTLSKLVSASTGTHLVGIADGMDRDLEAKQRILDEYVEASAYYGQNTAPAGELHGLLTAVKLLATPYADMDGYREEWKAVSVRTAHTGAMAWEWVAPVATGLTGIAGAAFTWWAGHQGRRHAETVAIQTTSASLDQAREARRADAYLDILRSVYAVTGVVNYTTAVIHVQQPEDSPFPSPDEQVAARAKVALYGTRKTRELHEEWNGHVQTLIKNHKWLRRNEDEDPRGKSRAEVRQEQDTKRAAMRAAADRLTEQMNLELVARPNASLIDPST
ncbi:DUF6221 family protein [Nonomuraea sp. MTCD27]|uniref:DUF6221 family protein n=1 Tax=Nonomuraea sp. MTCD27 TaxID=1676747 RepID=UPI0035BF9C40